MFFNDKQTKEFVDWYEDRYGTTNYADAILPKYKEEEEKKAREEKLTEILGTKKAKQKYIHKGGRVDTYLGKALESLRLNYGPVFKDLVGVESVGWYDGIAYYKDEEGNKYSVEARRKIGEDEFCRMGKIYKVERVGEYDYKVLSWREDK